MKELHFERSGLHLLCQVDDAGRLQLQHIGISSAYDHPNSHRFTPVELKITGQNVDDHHGGKHTGCGVFFDEVEETADELIFHLHNDWAKAMLHYHFYDGVKALRSYTEVVNTTEEPIGLEYVSAFCLYGLDMQKIYIPHSSCMRELDWRCYQPEELGYTPITPFSMKRIAAANTGTWSTKEYLPMGCVQGATDTLLWQIESSASWNWELSDLAGCVYLKLSGPSEQENGWWKQLAPGERYCTPTAAVSFSADGFDGAVAEMTAYRRHIAHSSAIDRPPLVIFNDYMKCLNADPTTEKELPVIERAAAAGAEVFCMDAGWYAEGGWWETVGEWQVANSRFPGGLNEVFDAVRAHGMIPGIWLEPEVMGIHCPLASQWPDECFFCRHGKRVIDHGRYQLDFRHPIVREHLTRIVEGLIRDYGIGYFKFDYNIDAGVGTEVAADSFGDGLEQHTIAFLDWVEELYARHPDLLLENCSSGGMRMDYRMLSHFSLQSLTDAENYRDTASIAAMSGTAVLPEQAAVWVIPTMEDTLDTVALNMVNAVGKRVHLSGSTPFLEEAAFARICEGVAYYKSVREEITCSVPFYPLGLCHFGDPFIACGYRGKEKTILCVTRLGEKAQVALHLSASFSRCRIAYPAEIAATAEIADGQLLLTLPPESGVVLELQ